VDFLSPPPPSPYTPPPLSLFFFLPPLCEKFPFLGKVGIGVSFPSLLSFVKKGDENIIFSSLYFFSVGFTLCITPFLGEGREAKRERTMAVVEW